jgi:three-Cys-motif partner protein
VKNFFREQEEQSLVKSTIVVKYFDAWANVIINSQKKYHLDAQEIAYIDLFAGPGRYEDGSRSTPIIILEKAITNPELRKRLISIFNDKDKSKARSLESVISEIPNIDTLTHKPSIFNADVGSEVAKLFERVNLIPTHFFVDPRGYRGLSLRLVNSVLKDWGCDAIFFFNYNRINMGLNNPLVADHMNALFGDDRAGALRDKLDGKSTDERELLILEELCQAIKEYGSRYILPFRFMGEGRKRTSHHLIFVSKHVRGYEIMKDIMAKESSSDEQGVPSFEYNPADFLPRQTLLFHLSRPLDELKQDLLVKFAGRELTMEQVYQQHNIDTPYVKKNYKAILRTLYDDGVIHAVSPKGKPPRGTSFGDNIIVTFPG